MRRASECILPSSKLVQLEGEGEIPLRGLIQIDIERLRLIDTLLSELAGGKLYAVATRVGEELKAERVVIGRGRGCKMCSVFLSISILRLPLHTHKPTGRLPLQRLLSSTVLSSVTHMRSPGQTTASRPPILYTAKVTAIHSLRSISATEHLYHFQMRLLL